MIKGEDLLLSCIVPVIDTHFPLIHLFQEVPKKKKRHPKMDRLVKWEAGLIEK